jgi:polysaccharide export outer membrane protein
MQRRDFIGRLGACAALTAPLGAAGCAALPRSGPLTVDMRTAERPEDIEGLVAPLTATTAATVSAPPPPGFPAAFTQAAALDPTRIGVDDRLDITIWESEGAGVFNPGGGATMISSAVVDPSGRIFIPFAGMQPAAGATIAQLRERVRRALEPLTLSPQVDVRLSEARSRLVSVQGAVARPGVYPIERSTARLGAMLAQAGGARDLPERVEVAVTRAGVTGRQILADLLEDSSLDIALRPDDQIVLSSIRERFIALGASSTQAEITFPTRPLDLLSAIGAMRGLRDFDADPTGVFLFRYEDQAVADALLPGPEPEGVPQGPGRPIVYRLDLSQPESFFVARAFQMRDGDAIFVTNAPLTELRKFLQLFNSVVAPVNTVDNLSVP